MKIIEMIFNLLFPVSCELCGSFKKKYICEECLKKLDTYVIKTNIRTRRYHLLKYNEFIREKMINYKFNDKAYLYKMFFEICINNKNACDFIKSYDIIIPVPIHKKRKKQRGYNQSELIAKQLASYLNIVFYKDILIKEKNVVAQSSLSKEKRIQNVKNVYKIKNKEKILGKKVLIFDDIYTTGATTNECKDVIILAGAKEVGIFTIAKD